jgi:uncharacterized membrane protein
MQGNAGTGCSTEDGNLTVFLPSAPAAFTGMVHVVSRDRVVFLDVKLSELIRSILDALSLAGVKH